MHKKDRDILKKYINNDAHTDEQAKAEKLIRADQSGLKDYMSSDWKQHLTIEEDIEKDLTAVLDKVHHRIHLNENSRKLALTRKLYRWYSAAAAIIIIPLLIAGAISVSKLNSAQKLLAEKASTVVLESPKGSRMKFQMPDGSEVVLNGGSTLHYDIPFVNNRNVKLQGEAYFDVHHDKKHPFVVSTTKMDIKVLGTSFNVNAYPDDKLAEVVLVQGKVECIIGKQEIMMHPNERVTLSGTSQIIKSNVNVDKYTAWKKGTLIFKGDSMNEVAKKISRWYDVEVKVVELNDYSFRATFQNDSLEEVFRLLQMSSPIEYKIIPRQKQPDGSFSKKQVFIYKKGSKKINNQ
ncbi:FecR family protein [Puteibacter caeruleilacunae]|nr:FecR family protein [Puteibacter caeruleilacunae]